MRLSAEFPAFCEFARRQLLTHDIDPAYPVLLHHLAHKPEFEHMTVDERSEACHWHLAVYVAYYHLGSAEQIWRRWPTPPDHVPDDASITLPTGIERRGFRGNTNAATFLNSYLAQTRCYEGADNWAHAKCTPYGANGWAQFRASAQATIRFVGPWASYKWADLLKHVMGISITADDLGVGGGSETAGPIPGMVQLTGRPWQECAEDPILQDRLMGEAQQRGVHFNGLDQLETALCDWNSLTKGRYYVGHDIDQMMDYLAPDSALWAARAATLPAQMLGENHGWHGVRPELKRLYKDHQKLFQGGRA